MDIVNNLKPELDITATWATAQDAIKSRIGEIAFNTWFGPLKIKASAANTLCLEVPDVFFKEWFEKHYRELVSSIIHSQTGIQIPIEISINPALIKKKEKTRLQEFESRIRDEDVINTIKLNPKYTFENFIIGPSNRFTHAACLAVAEAPAKNYNPLFIYGKVGLGKTHLMQAICHFIKNRAPKTTISYMSSEKFTNELISAIQHHSMQNFRKKYRNSDILLLDDIHFIAGKESTQEEFFHTFNALHDAHKQIIISSDRSPKEIPKLEERLISRFSWGLITDIQPPDLETRIAILKKKLENERVNIPMNVLFFVGESITSNIRELEGALVRLLAYSLLEGKEITLPLAQDILKDMLRESVKKITVDIIQKEVANFYNLNLSEFKNKNRNKNIVLARQIAMFLSRELTELSLPEIGQNFGGKDHTTVLHSYNKIKNNMTTDVRFQELVNRITLKIKGDY